jgi:hypothetical protein
MQDIYARNLIIVIVGLLLLLALLFALGQAI